MGKEHQEKKNGWSVNRGPTGVGRRSGGGVVLFDKELAT